MLGAVWQRVWGDAPTVELTVVGWGGSGLLRNSTGLEGSSGCCGCRAEQCMRRHANVRNTHTWKRMKIEESLGKGISISSSTRYRARLEAENAIPVTHLPIVQQLLDAQLLGSCLALACSGASQRQ